MIYCSLYLSYPSSSGQEQYTTHSTGSLLSQRGTVWLLALPQTENHAESEEIWGMKGYYEKSDSGAPCHSIGVPEVLLVVAQPMGEVCELSKGLNGICEIYKIYFMSKGWIFFECISYRNTTASNKYHLNKPHFL